MLSPRLQECLFYSREANNQTAMFSTQTRSLENASLGKLLWCQVSISRSPQRQNQGKDLRYNHGLGESWSWDISNLFCVPLTPSCFSAHTQTAKAPALPLLSFWHVGLLLSHRVSGDFIPGLLSLVASSLAGLEGFLPLGPRRWVSVSL